MLKVGLTGNIASGKSTVVEVWRALGARVVDADELARRVVQPGSPALHRIAERWGPDLLDASGQLDRDAMRSIVFANPGARAELESIIHPRVAELRAEQFALAEREGASVIVADIPLLFEVGLAGDFDLVVLVDAPEEVRRDRIVRDRGLDPAEAERMVAAQLPSAHKRPMADIIVDNTCSLLDLRAEAERVWLQILRRAEART